MKIAHIPSFQMMFSSFDLHMKNMINLENFMGIKSLLCPPVHYYLDEKIPDFDIIHIHGVPPLDACEPFLVLIKRSLLTNKKVIISNYNYSAFSSSPTNRNQSNEENIFQKVFSFLKDIDIFVYSNEAEKIFKSKNFKKVHKIPICYFGEREKFEAPKYDSSVTNRIGYFNYVDDIEFFEEKRVVEQIKNLNSEFKFYSLDYSSLNFEVDLGLCPFNWSNSFPIEVGLFLASGCPVVLNKDFKFDDFDILQNAVRFVDFDEKLISTPQTFESRRDLAYLFWNSFGTDTCLAWYDSIYQLILKH